MRIAVCDDEPVQRQLLKKYVEEWGTLRSVSLQFMLFESAEAFLFRWEEDRTFDLLILDIEMGQMNGMELAMKLREQKEKLPILFVTGFEQYMPFGYEVDALHYLLKPIQKEKLFSVLDRAADSRLPEEREVFQAEEGVISLPLSDIWYFEAQGHSCILHTENASYTLHLGISAVRERFVHRSCFVSCHRSYFVNLKHVSVIEKTEAVLDDKTRLPVSRGAFREVNRAFIRFYCG